MVKIGSPQAIGTANLTVSDGKIVSVELLEGNNELTAPEVIQYVNIQTNPAQHVDGTTITHVDRCGQKLRLKVKFDKGGVFSFKVKLEPDGGNVAYTPTEKTRNNNFNFSDGLTTSADCDGDGYIKFTTNNNGEKIIDADKIFVSPAGGDIFSISAKDGHGNEVVAKSKVKTERAMYYMEIKMAGLKGAVSDLKPVIKEYKKHGIKIEPTTSASIAYSANIDPNTELTNFENNVKTKYLGASDAYKKDPYCVVITYTEHVKVKLSGALPPVAATGGGTAPIRVPVEDASGHTYPLWNNVIPGENWFIDGYFVENFTGNVTPIDESLCKLKQSIQGYPEGYYDCVDINVSSLPKKAGNIILEVNVVALTFSGIALKTNNIVGVCLKPWWKTAPKPEQVSTIIHEVGHKFGMVADNTAVDSTPYFYTGMGHIGNHCSYGMPSGLSTYENQGGAKCVMFGGTSGKNSFCTECVKALKKVDLSAGM